MDAYVCKTCGKPVVVLDGKIVRPCTPTCEATVVANLEATVSQDGGLKQG